jgi:regulator of sigma E protease
MVSTFLTDTIVVIIVLGFMIFFHELGHFIAAKAFGVRVLTFSLGFGKRLFGFKKGDTDYRVSLLPFGGYVKMAGDDPSDLRQGSPGEYLEAPRWQRFCIVSMGPFMNIVLSIILLTGLNMFHFQKPAFMEQVARIGDLEDNSPAQKAGLQAGDTILRLGSVRNPKWEDIDLKIATGVNESIPLEINRDGKIIETSIVPQAKGRDEVGYAGWYPYAPAYVNKLEPGMPAEKAGIQVGDEIVAIDGHKDLFYGNIPYDIQVTKGKPITVTVFRNGKPQEFHLQPTQGDVMGQKAWLIGVTFRNEMVVKRLPFERAFAAAIEFDIKNCLATFDVLGKVLTRHMSPRTLSGPIGIAQLSGEAYRAGIPALIMLVSFISLQLGIFNLLPIPILDGGVILLLLVESLIRRDLSLQVKERFVQVGIVFLLLLAVFVMYNDIVKNFSPR